MKEKITLFWFRRDLRLNDNAALYYALKQNATVLPIFIYDTEILQKLEDKHDRRVDFISQTLAQLQHELQICNSSLKVLHTDPLSAFKQLVREHNLSKVYANHDYEPAAVQRDKLIGEFLLENGIQFITYKDQCVFEKNEVLKDDGKPYTVFTPYSVKWKKALQLSATKNFPSESLFSNFLKISPVPLPTLSELGFKKTDLIIPKKQVTNVLLQNYKNARDYPALHGTSHLSIHLRFGTISIRRALQQASLTSETWLNELIWRDFYMMILWHFPHVATGAFKKQYDRIEWRNNETEFEKWREGKTGFPIVDAGMRELNTTGFMHNRVRMIVSSFLVKDLLIDWRWGEAYFAQKLNDFDLSANNGGWQWAAGSGCDAAPYFRIFNPTEQQKKFDPNFEYIKKWVPEFGTPFYPSAMVNHAAARIKTLEVYKRDLNGETARLPNQLNYPDLIQ
ncbi:MAG: deoxyribodipyrimidine photo-lyase [bacterium]|nr:deoxyribodipyrimidine photo-lyase [bacterium]